MFFSSRSAVLGVCVLLLAPVLAAAPSSQDLDLSFEAEFVARRYRLYDDALVLAEQIADKDTRGICKARIKVQQAQNDPDRRDVLYNEALALLEGKDVSDGVKLERATLMLDRIEAKGADAADRATTETLIADLFTLKKTIYEEAQKISIEWRLKFPDKLVLFSGAHYQYARSLFLRSRMEPNGSSARHQYVEQLVKSVQSMMFEVAIETAATYDAYILCANAYRSIGEFRKATSRSLELASLFEGVPRTPGNMPIISYQSLRGYLLAIEILLGDLGNDPEAVTEARELIATALREFPLAASTPQGKELRMYDIAAIIKQGKNVTGALKSLFAMLGDEDPVFRAKAARQLARIALNPSLSNEQRMLAARRVAAVDNSSEIQMLAAQAFHAVLANTKTRKDFETFAPACYLELGNIFESLARYLDCVTILREGADRFHYLRKNNPKWDDSGAKLAAHFFDADGKPWGKGKLGNVEVALATEDDAYEFSKHLATRAKRAAAWLVSDASGGDSTNKELRKIVLDVDKWYAKYEGLEQRYSSMTVNGLRAFNDKKYLNSALMLMSALPNDPGVVRANLTAGKALVKLLEPKGYLTLKPEPGLQNFFIAGYDLPGDDIVKGQPDYTGQRARIESDFPNLPWLHAEMQGMVDRLLSQEVAADAREQLWLMAQYALKRALLFQLNAEVTTLEAAGIAVTGLSPGAALAASARFDNREMLALPEGSRKPSEKALQTAEVCLLLAWAMRTPDSGIVDTEQRKQRIETLRSSALAEALVWLDTTWNGFGPHLKAAMRRDEGKADNSGADNLNSLLRLRFYAHLEAEDANAALDDFSAYREIFEQFGSETTRNGFKDELRKMLNALKAMQIKALVPRYTTAVRAAELFESYAVRLTKDWPEVSARPKFEKESPGKAFASLPASEQRERVAAYLLDYMDATVFGPDAALKLRDGTPIPLALGVPSSMREAFHAMWNERKAYYLKLYGEVSAAQCQRLLDSGVLNDVKDVAQEAIRLFSTQGADAGNEYLNQKITAEKATQRLGQLTRLTQVLGEKAQEYEWMLGVAFKSEMVEYFNARGQELRTLAASPQKMYSDTLELIAQITNKPLYSTGAEARGFGQRYSAVRDYAKAYFAWKEYYATKASEFPDVASIPVDSERRKIANADACKDEIETRYMLGLAALELYASDTAGERKAECIDVALKNLRRCYNYVLWRDAVDKAKDKKWKSNYDADESGFAITLDRMYVDILNAYTRACSLCARDGITPQWDKKYYAQSFGMVSKEQVTEAEQKGQLTDPFFDGAFFRLPVSSEELLDAAIYVQRRLFFGLGEKPGGFYDPYYRSAMFWWASLALERAEKKNGSENVAIRGEVCKTMHGIATQKPYVFEDRSKEFVARAIALRDEVAQKLPAEWLQKNIPDLNNGNGGNGAKSEKS